MPAPFTNPDGSLRAFTLAEYDAMRIERRGVEGAGDHVVYSLGPDGSGCPRKFFCDWDQRFNAAIYFAGASKTYTDGGGDFKISRLMPSRDPDFPNWICTKVRISPFRFMGEIEDPGDDSEPLPKFDRAELECTFEMVPFELAADADTVAETDRYVTWPGFPGAEITTETTYIGLTGNALVYATSDGTTATGPAGTPIQFGAGFTEGSSNFRVVWRRVPADAWGPSTVLGQRVLGTVAGRGYVGAVNKTTFHGYAAHSLQLRGVEARLLPDPTGLGYAWDIAYVMSEKPTPYGHLGIYFHDVKTVGNQSGYYQILRPSAGTTIKAPGTIGDTDSLFIEREFANLFVPGEL